MTEAQAIQAQQEIEAVFKKHGVWYDVRYSKRPNLTLIRFEDVSIKVQEEKTRIKR